MDFKNIDSRIIALGIARMADGVANSFLIVVLPLYIASGQIGGWNFGMSEAAITGVILGSFGIINSIVQPFAGKLSDALGKRKIFIFIGLLLVAFVNVSYLWFDDYLGILAVRIVQAAAASLTIVGSVTLVSELSPREGRGRNMGVYNSFRLIGFGAGPLGAGALVSGGPYILFGNLQLTGFELSFYGAGAAGIISALLVAFLVSDPDHIKPSKGGESTFRILAEKPGQLLDPIFTLGIASLFMAACIAMLSPIETIVNDRLGQGPFLFAVEFASFIGTQAFIQPSLGSLSDKYGRRRFILLGLFCLIPTTMLQGLVVAPWQMIVARLFQGFSSALVFAPALALAGDLAKEGQSGAQLSVLTVSFGLGIAFGQFLSGFLVQFGYFIPFGAGALLAAVGMVLVYTQVGDDSADKSESSALRDGEDLKEKRSEALQQNYQC